MKSTDTLLEDYSDSEIKSRKGKVISSIDNGNKPQPIPQSEKTKDIGRFDAWNQEKFEVLQANTKRQFVEYHKLLAYYQNELDKFRGKKTEGKIVSEVNANEYTIPTEDKTFSAGEFDSWSQEMFDELTENTQRQFHDYDLLLERSKKQLDRYKEQGDENKTEWSKKEINKTTQNYSNGNDSNSIIEEIKHAITDCWNEIKKKEKTEKQEKEKEEKRGTPKPITKGIKRIVRIVSVLISIGTLYIVASLLLKWFF